MGLVDFAIELKLQSKNNCNKSCPSKKHFRASSDVHTNYSLPEWQAVKLTFFAPCIWSVFFGEGWGCLFIASRGADLSIYGT